MQFTHIIPISEAKEKELLFIEIDLINKGYMISRPAGNDYIYLSGLNRKYFNAKEQKAKSIIENMKFYGYAATATKATDGYFDIKVTGLIKPYTTEQTTLF